MAQILNYDTAIIKIIQEMPADKTLLERCNINIKNKVHWTDGQ